MGITGSQRLKVAAAGEWKPCQSSSFLRSYVARTRKNARVVFYHRRLSRAHSLLPLEETRYYFPSFRRTLPIVPPSWWGGSFILHTLWKMEIDSVREKPGQEGKKHESQNHA